MTGGKTKCSTTISRGPNIFLPDSDLQSAASWQLIAKKNWREKLRTNDFHKGNKKKHIHEGVRVKKFVSRRGKENKLQPAQKKSCYEFFFHQQLPTKLKDDRLSKDKYVFQLLLTGTLSKKNSSH